MAYRLDSQRIIDVSEHAAQAAISHTSPQSPSRSFGFHNSEQCKPGASPLHHAPSSVSSPCAAVSLAELSTTSPSPAISPFPGGGAPLRASKRVGISPHDEHSDWDFLKSRTSATGLSTCATATEPGVILSTVQRGLAHVPERRPLTEAEASCFGTSTTKFLRPCSQFSFSDRRRCIKRNSPQRKCSCEAAAHASVHGSKSGEALCFFKR